MIISNFQIGYRLSLCNQDVTSEDLLAVERYVVLLYDKTTSLSDVNEARRHLFTKKACPSENIPPTKDALYINILRELYFKEGKYKFISFMYIALTSIKILLLFL